MISTGCDSSTVDKLIDDSLGSKFEKGRAGLRSYSQKTIRGVLGRRFRMS